MRAADRSHPRLWKEGVCDLVMELCCALHNFRVRLTPVAGNDLIGINSMECTIKARTVYAMSISL